LPKTTLSRPRTFPAEPLTVIAICFNLLGKIIERKQAFAGKSLKENKHLRGLRQRKIAKRTRGKKYCKNTYTAYLCIQFKYSLHTLMSQTENNRNERKNSP